MPLHVLCVGWEVKIDMNGQSNDCLWVCNVKMKKFLLGPKQGTFLRIFRLRGRGIKWLELFFSKMLKLDETDCQDSKMSDFEWFGEVFKIIMFNMFLWFYHSLLIFEGNSCPILMFEYSFWSLEPPLQESELILPLGSLQGTQKWQKCAKNSQHWHFSDTCRPPSGNFSSDSCRGGSNLWNEYSNIKIRQVLTSEMRKMWGNLKFLHDHKSANFLGFLRCQKVL